MSCCDLRKIYIFMILKQLQNDLLTICICLNYGGVKVACYVVGVRH